MNVFFYRYGSIAEPDIIKAMKTMDFSVDEYTREIHDKEYAPSAAVREVGAYLQEHPADCAFSINFFPFLSEVCNIFHIRYICLTVDCPVMELYSVSVKNEWNRIFVFDREQQKDIEGYNPGHVFHQPLGADVTKFDTLLSTTPASVKERFSHPVAFVGSLYTEKCPYDKVKDLPEKTAGYLDGLMAAQERVYGYYFVEELLTDRIVSDFKSHHPSFYRDPSPDSFLTDKRTLSQLYIANKIASNERIHTFSLVAERNGLDIYTASDTKKMPKGLKNRGLAKTLTEMPVIFNQSKINLNVTSKAIRSGLPLRIFDILSSGGLCITNYQSEIAELFVPGEEIVVYESTDELPDLISYYLSNEGRRAEIAAAGRERVKKDYSWEMQLSKLFLKAYSV